MNVKKWTLLVVMMGVLLATAFAIDENEITKNRADFMKERKAYFKENIKPKIDAQRNKLESSISDKDKNEIARLREEMMNERLMQNEFIFEGRAARIKGEETDEGLRLEIRAQHIVIENIHDKAKIIANKYRPEIDDLLAEIKTLRKENGSHMRYHKREFENRNRNGRKRSHGPEHGRMMGLGSGNGSPRDFGIVTFLLWDANRG